MTMRLDWHGDDIKRKASEAARRGIDETMGACIGPAKERTPVVTGAAQGSVKIVQLARHLGNRLVGLWGSADINYYIWIEIGARGRTGRYPLRRAADQEYPSLAQRIKRHFR